MEKKFDDMKEYNLSEFYQHVTTHMDAVSKFVGENCDENGVMSDDINDDEIRKVLDGSIAAQAICETFFNHLKPFTADMEDELKCDLIKFFRSAGDYARHFNEQATTWMAIHGIPLDAENKE